MKTEGGGLSCSAPPQTLLDVLTVLSQETTVLVCVNDNCRVGWKMVVERGTRGVLEDVLEDVQNQ